MVTRILVVLSILTVLGSVLASAQGPGVEPGEAPAVAPVSITCEECPYPYPSAYLPMTLYGQDVRMAYMDVPPAGPPNGHTVVLLHGNNFAGFYFGAIAEALRAEGFRIIIPDRVGYGRSSKPIIPYSFNDWARHTRDLLQRLDIESAMIVGHSMGGMLAARFATQYPGMTERLVLYNPIGLSDARFDRPAGSVDEAYARNLGATYRSVRAGLMRYVAHDPVAWNDAFETYARIRYGWTLGADWPRLAMVQALAGSVIYADPVVYDWPHIRAPTLVFGGAEDMLPGSAEEFRERMEDAAETIPGARLLLLRGLGHVPHVEAPERTIPPLVAFLAEGV
ncbi:MAG: alpha/beta hydrolase [Acidobacteria bacterium]|nr:alpha/beta hydrolase [Acidobacteriota bacterium]